MTSDPIRPMKVELRSVKEEFKAGPFRLLTYTTAHETYRGTMHPFPWIVFERGNSVSVILYKRDTQEVVLVRQFRAPTLRLQANGHGYELRDDGQRNDGQLDETIAGMPKPGESYEDCAIRETYEETGYRVKPNRLRLISQFFVSPGGTSERIYLYYAEVNSEDHDPKRDKEIAGNKREGESILVRHIKVSDFFDNFTRPDMVVDSKVLIASMLVRETLNDRPDAATQVAPLGRKRYVLKRQPEFSIVIRTGDMRRIDDVDGWVNSENTDMEMDRFVGKSVSSLIRYEGAVKDAKERVIDDTIGDALKKKMRGRFGSIIGTVHDTTPGDLKKKNVKRLFHVAAVQGHTGQRPRADLHQIASVTKKALLAVEDRSNSYITAKCASALLPMIGTGDAGLTTEEAFPKIVEGVLAFFDEKKRKSYLKTVHVSAYKQRDVEAAYNYLDQSEDFEARD